MPSTRPSASLPPRARASTVAKPQRRARTEAQKEGPYVGALLRLAWQSVRERILVSLNGRGFGDINQTHLSVFQYPPPDGVRASDLAHRAPMTKQAMNYLLLQLETLGYIERRAGPNGRRRLVYLTARGWQVTETIWATLRQLQGEWAQSLGLQRFDQFLATLKELATLAAEPAKQKGKRQPRVGLRS